MQGADEKKPPAIARGRVPGTGIEPALSCDNQILSLTRLPVPPSGLFRVAEWNWDESLVSAKSGRNITDLVLPGQKGDKNSIFSPSILLLNKDVNDNDRLDTRGQNSGG